jgi:predicted transcriptional regulator of viral defense system
MKSVVQRAPDHIALYDLAEQQAGYFTAHQAVKAGFSWERLTEHSKNGRFHRVAHGTYRLAQFPSSRFEDLFVAWLKCGPYSAISHESALALYDLSDILPGQVHVTVPRTASRRRKGIRMHTNRLKRAEVVRREGLPVTSVPRTIADVARAGLSEEHVARAIRDALQRGLTTKPALLQEARRRGGRAGRLLKLYSNSSRAQS